MMNVSRLDLPEKLNQPLFAKAILTTWKKQKNGTNHEESFVIELKPTESLKNLIVEPSNFTSKTSKFLFFRNEFVKPLKIEGLQIFQNLTKKFKENKQSKFKKVIFGKFALFFFVKKLSNFFFRNSNKLLLSKKINKMFSM